MAELQGRVVIMDKAGKVVSTLGDNPDQKQWDDFKLAPEFWRDGIFIAPHGLSFDKDGNLFVQDLEFHRTLHQVEKGRRQEVLSCSDLGCGSSTPQPHREATRMAGGGGGVEHFFLYVSVFPLRNCSRGVVCWR